MCISRFCTATRLDDLFVTLGLLGIIVRQIMHSVKLGYLVRAVTVHLLLFLFECHGNKEYVRALHVCVRTYLYV